MSNVPKGYSALRILPCSDKNDFPDIAALYLEEAGKKLQALPQHKAAGQRHANTVSILLPFQGSKN